MTKRLMERVELLELEGKQFRKELDHVSEYILHLQDIVMQLQRSMIDFNGGNIGNKIDNEQRKGYFIVEGS